MREKIGHMGEGVWGGVPFFKKTSSSDSKATATNQMHCNDLGASVVVLVPFRSQVFDMSI